MHLVSITILCALAPVANGSASSSSLRATDAQSESTRSADVRVEGLVLDAHKKPAAGVRVMLGELGHALLIYSSPPDMFVTTPGILDPDAQRYKAELATDRDGRFVASALASGEYTLIAADKERGIAITSVHAEPGAASKIEIVLDAPCFLDAEITGLEFDSQTNTIELLPLGLGTNVTLFPRLAQRDRSWSFQSPALPAARGWRVVGSAVVPVQDYRATLFALPLTIAAGEHAHVAVDLARGLELSGTVVDARGESLSGVSVVARSPGENASMRGAVTDAKGRYHLRGLSSGACTLDVGRWRLRELAGCGNGPQDVSASREIVLPLANASDADFKIETLMRAPQIGDVAPTFSARTIDGGTLTLSSLRGKVVLIDFWATWCGMCRVEMPNMLATQRELAHDGLEIIGASVDTDVALVPRFVASRGLPWPQTALGGAAANPIARLFNVSSTPSTVLIDRQGKIAALNLIGEPLRKKIEELLAAK
jgi:peroxiredoxin